MKRPMHKHFDENWRVTASGCHEWQRAKNSAGYGHFCINKKFILAHRFAWERKCGRIPTGMNVLHRCDNPACVNPDHLFLGSQAANIADMDRKGRRVTVFIPRRGEAATNAKVTAGKVRAMRAMWRRGGITQRSIAKQFGIRPPEVCRIISGQRWAHLAR